MPYLDGNKKKIRGWKRRIKHIEDWKQRYIHLDIEQLERYDRDYVKLWINPFYRLTKRNPPVWYARLIFGAMIEVYESWHEQLKLLNEPFDLNMWVYDPNFIYSQIVVAFRDQLHFYDHTFEPSPIEKGFPVHLYGKRLAIEKFEWKLAIEADYYLLSELNEDIGLGFRTEKEIKNIQNKAYKQVTIQSNSSENLLYSVQMGDVWIGEYKPST